MARDVTALAVALAGLFLAQRGFYEVIMGGIEGAAEMRGGGGRRPGGGAGGGGWGRWKRRRRKGNRHVREVSFGPKLQQLTMIE